MKNNQGLIIIGAGGHGKVAAEIAQLSKRYENIFFLDDKKTIECGGFKIIGTINELYKFINNYPFFIAIGDNKKRKYLMTKLMSLGANITTLIHPSAVISNSSSLGKGTIIMPNVVINNSCKIGNGVIINTAATIDHDNYIDDYSHISVGCHLGGSVVVYKKVFLGIGTVVKNNITICENTIVGAGAVIVKDIKNQGVYVGNPAILKSLISLN